MESYDKVRVVGSGSFGDAWLVTHKVTKEDCVIKCIPCDQKDSDQMENTAAEIHILSSFHHPYIVKYEGSFQEEGSLYIAMEFCAGGDLSKRVKKQRARYFPEELILDWVAQITLALEHVHARNILHRDLKLDNLFLTDKDVCKLGDFGIARILDSTIGHAQTAIGTLFYLSPEICRNEKYNHKSDVWALGVVIYKLASLDFPFEAKSVTGMVSRIVRCKYRKLPNKFSGALGRLIGDILVPNPSDRPSINEVLAYPVLVPFVQKWRIKNEAAESSTTSTGQLNALASVHDEIDEDLYKSMIASALSTGELELDLSRPDTVSDYDKSASMASDFDRSVLSIMDFNNTARSISTIFEEQPQTESPASFDPPLPVRFDPPLPVRFENGRTIPCDARTMSHSRLQDPVFPAGHMAELNELRALWLARRHGKQEVDEHGA